MPMYDYQCPCGHKFEENKMIDRRDEPVICHKCGGQAYRMPAAPAFKVKGFNAENGYSHPYQDMPKDIHERAAAAQNH